MSLRAQRIGLTTGGVLHCEGRTPQRFWPSSRPNCSATPPTRALPYDEGRYHPNSGSYQAGSDNLWHVLSVDVDLERLREVCERYGVASLDVFGSTARGENGPDSDIDLLYVLKPGVRLGFKLFDLEDELAALFGRPVDLVGRKSVNKYIRDQVLADAQPLYAA